MLQQAQFGPTGCRGCSGSGEHALAVTQSISSQAKHVLLTGSSPCSLCGRFAVCFAGGVITGFHSEARNEHISECIHTSNDLLRRLMSKHSRANSQLSDRCADAEDVQNTENAPAVSMGPYLLKSGQTSLERARDDQLSSRILNQVLQGHGHRIV